MGNQARLAKNTLLLYARSLFTMCVGIYTSRILLDALGVTDFGIHSLIAGVVGMFCMLSATFVSTTQRCITYELGTGDIERTRQTFSAAIRIHLLLAAVLLLAFETIGLVLFYKLEIPEERLDAAFVVYQLSAVWFIVEMLVIPFTAVIIARERMNIFAYVAIVESVFKLVNVYIIVTVPFDRLMMFSSMVLLLSVIKFAFNAVYCVRNFPEARFVKVVDKSIYKQMLTLTTWIFFGAGSSILAMSGINIVINLFFGVTVNAAKGVVGQIENAVRTLLGNFLTALQPQIVKAYSSEDREYLNVLVDRGSRFAFYLTVIMVVPLVTCADYVLRVWLVEVPNYAIEFLQLTMIYCLITPLGTILDNLMLANGDVRTWQIISCIIELLVLPVMALVFYCGAEPYFAYVVMVGILGLSYVNKIYFCHLKKCIEAKIYIRRVLVRSLGVMFLSLVTAYMLRSLATGSDLIDLVIVGVLSVLVTVVVIVWFGMNKEELFFIRMALLKQ